MAASPPRPGGPAGTRPAVRLVAVSKTVPAGAASGQAVAAGQRLFGENYLQEARDKIEALGEAVSWHFIGHLQSNKAKAAVELFDLIHAVDRLKLAEALDAAAASKGTVQKILMQVNLAGEATEIRGQPGGSRRSCWREISPAAAPAAVGPDDHAALVSRPRGGAPLFPGPAGTAGAAARPGRDLPLTELSMGMSGDFEVAIEEGATLVRVGTAIFGSRG